MAEQRKKTKKKSSVPKKTPVVTQTGTTGNLKFLLPILAITFIAFIPALSNGFTNWDDIMYVTGNSLLKELNFEGIKNIFTTPVVSNYHPLTILSLAINYQLAELTPWSYHLTSIFLHLANTALVFWFILYLSSGNKWVSGCVALLFGIHPMHVESVAWISERKDLLYTLFYLSAMIVYIQYLRNKKTTYILMVTGLGALSLLSKPAAIVLPLSLLLIDFYFRRQWSWKWVIEKIPLFIMSGIIAYATFAVQLDRAIASVGLYSILERFCFAGFGLIWYLLKILVPYPLSALHPFPESLSIWYYLATVAAIGGVAFLLFKVKNRNYLFGFGFYIVNLLLVLQLVSIGNAVVAERYTYVPYIGIFFLVCMEIYKLIETKWAGYRRIILGIGGVWIVLMMVMTWMRIPVWKSSETLWENILQHYPDSPRAWTNKGLIYYDQKDWNQVIEHLSNALKYDPLYADALEWRARSYLETKEYDKALSDALAFQKARPTKTVALFLLARIYDASGNNEEALNMYNKLIPLEPNMPEYVNNRGTLYFNKLQNYEAAKKDFEQSIQLNPSIGLYYLNLSRCYYMLGDAGKAKEYAQQAKQLGSVIDPSYAQLIGLE